MRSVTTDLAAVASQAMQLQNAYAYAIDAREWSLFETIFTDDVVAEYPHATYHDVRTWLGAFIPLHDTYLWCVHAMTNHLVGQDTDGHWATCYGSVLWVHKDEPDRITRSTVLYRDRLHTDGDTWRISRRRLDLLMSETSSLSAAGARLIHSIRDLTAGP